jgi:hypothetical protein
VGGGCEPLLEAPELLLVLPPELVVVPLLEPPLLELVLLPVAPLLLLPPVDDPVSLEPPLPLEPEAVEPVGR